MEINRGNLRTIYVGFRTDFQGAFAEVTPTWSAIAMAVPSTTRENQYGWLGKFPRIREWIGDRVVNSIAASDYTIRNKDFEGTISLDRNDIADDLLGIYKPIVQEFGRSTATHPDELAWGLLTRGWDAACYDGQPFFDTDHPVLDAAGKETFYSNSGGGNGAPWFLIDDRRVIKPVIYQERQTFNFVALDNPDDANVFFKKQYIYGVDGRSNVGFSFPQLAYGSKQPLTLTSFETGYVNMSSLKADYERPLGIKPTKLVVGASNIKAANLIANSEKLDGDVVNPWKGLVTVVLSEWLP